MSSVHIVIHPIDGDCVSMELEGLAEYLYANGEPGKQHLLAGLEALVRAIRHSSSLLPTAEMLQ